jgi:CheY-like chemotaxis protein/DNA-binding HxlR family transcriptional regulator
MFFPPPRFRGIIASPRDRAASTPTAKMRILIADDDEDFREELTELLELGHHVVTAVPSAGQASAALENGEFDVLFTDIKMGRQSGMDLLAETRQKWPRVLVVMLTGKATVETAVRALQLGAFDYLRKPIKAEQVNRVLDLVGQQLALTRAGAKPLDPLRYASALAAEGGYEVLLISPPPVPTIVEKVSYLPLDPDNPFRVRDAVKDFVAPRDRAAVVLAAVEELLARHREEDIAALLEGMRAILEGKGPLAVGYDPNKITASGALAVRSSIVSADAHTTLESLGSPIRRLVLRRLAEGPASFTQTMEAAHLDDTSKIAFHLRKLTESGLVVHLARQRYRLTPRGRGAITILSSIDDLDSARGSGNRVFPSKVRKAPA